MSWVSILKVAIIACCFAHCFAQSNHVGTSRVLLDGSIESCRSYSCNLGNLIVDAMIDYNMNDYEGENSWTDAAIALHNSGSIAASIPKSNNITEADVNKALPYNDKIVKMDLTGKLIRQMLDHSVNYQAENKSCVYRNAFLHFAGLKVDYDLTAKSGSRVKSVSVRCAQCNIPEYKPLDPNTTYRVLTTDFIANGGDGYQMVKTITRTPIGATVNETVIKYLKRHDPVYSGIDRRMTFLDANVSDNMKNCTVEKNRDLPKPPEEKVHTGNGNKDVYGMISIILPSIIALIISR